LEKKESRSLLPPGGDFQLEKEVLDVNQMVVEDRARDVKELKDGLVAYRVEDIEAVLPANHNAPRAQKRQLLR
jgi:hypothetical protein